MCRAIYRPCTALAARKMQAEPCAPNTSPICTICGQLGAGTGATEDVSGAVAGAAGQRGHRLDPVGRRGNRVGPAADARTWELRSAGVLGRHSAPAGTQEHAQSDVEHTPAALMWNECSPPPLQVHVSNLSWRTQWW